MSTYWADDWDVGWTHLPGDLAEVLGCENQNIGFEVVVRLIEAKKVGHNLRSHSGLMDPMIPASIKDQHPQTSAKCEIFKKQFSWPLYHDHKASHYKFYKKYFLSQKDQFPKRNLELEAELKLNEGTKNVNHCSVKPITLTYHVFHDNLGWCQQASSDSDSNSGQDWLLPVWNTTMNNPTWRTNDCSYNTWYHSCFICLKAIYRLGFKRTDLIPVKHRISANNRDSINIIGEILLQLSGIDKVGFPLETARSVMLYLIQIACISLGRTVSIWAWFRETFQE